MRIQKYLWCFLLSTLLFSSKTFAQSEDNVIATANGKYSFSYNEVPDNIVAVNCHRTWYHLFLGAK